MPDDDRTREQLLEEVQTLRQRLADLEQAETRKRAAEETLRESVLRFRALIENSADAVTLLGPDGAIRYANPSNVRILGYSTQECEGLNAFDLVHPDDLALIRQVFELMLATPREAIPIQLRSRHKDGSWRWIDGKGTNLLDEPSVGAIVCNYRDVTSQVQANEERVRLAASLTERLDELRRSEQRLRRAQEIAQLGGFEWLLHPEETSYCSPELFRILGMDPAGGPVSRQTFVDQLIHPDDRPAFLQDLDRSLSEGRPFHQEFRIVRPEGHAPAQRVRWVRSLAEPLTDLASSPASADSPKVVGLAGTLLDVTERRQLEQQLLQARKMEAIGRLAGGVAHEFNNMLTVINGFADLLFGHWSADEMSREMINQVREAGERAASLTRQLLAFSRQTILAPVVLNLNDLIGQMEKMLRRLLRADVDLTVQLDPALGSIKIDKVQLEQVVLNLVLNARDAMPAGGKLSLETRNVHLEESSERADVRPGPCTLLSISDTGPGLDEQTRSQVFEPFFTTKELGRGTGLGLAVVFGFIKQSEGHVEVDSILGRGSTFRIYLPTVAPANPAGVREPALVDLPGGTETVLLVEDEEGVRRLAGTVLRRCGYVVLEAADGLDALAVLARTPLTIDLLVTDVIMPRMNGQELAAQVLRQFPGLKVLFVSGYTDEVIGHGGVLDPGTGYLQKPFTLTALTRKVRETLQR